MKLFSSPPPLAPPTPEEVTLSSLRLLRSRRVGPSTYHRLIAEHGSAARALEALPDIAREAGVHDYSVCPDGVAWAELREGRKAGAVLLIHGHPGYPAHLNDLDDAPPLLWALGNRELLTRHAIGIVGARNASSLGGRMAAKLARDLGEAGLVIVSGLARGIDACAHGAALETGTIAVVAGGVDTIYPAENAKLTQSIRTKGLVLSERPPGMTPQARHFPQRNRVISGVSHGLVVVEAAQKSGSLITARAALDQGREVFAVPGHPFDARASGCNALIRDGACLVRSAQDVLEALQVTQAPQPSAPEPRQAPLPLPPSTSTNADDPLQTRIIACLGSSPLAEDQLARDLGAAPGEISAALLDLELSGDIQRQPGGLIAPVQTA